MENNTIHNNSITTLGSTTNNWGIYFANNILNNVVTFNNINTSGTTANHGIYAIGTTTLPINNNVFDSNNINATGFAAASTNYGLYFTTNFNDNNITNNFVSTSGTTANYGISVIGTATATSNNNLINNNEIRTIGTTNNNWGIYLVNNANNNLVSYNNISTTGTSTNYGIYILGSGFEARNNSIIFNNISTQGTLASNHGVFLQSNVNDNNISNNNISVYGSNDNYGIYGLGTALLTVNNNLIDSNIVNTGGTGGNNFGVFFSTNSNNNSIFDNLISTNGNGNNNHGVYLITNTNNNNISNNEIITLGNSDNHGLFISTNALNNSAFNNVVSSSSPNSFAVHLFTTDNNLFEQNNVTGTYGYYIRRSSHNMIRDCSYTSGSDFDVFVQGDQSPPSINNTFLNCSYTSESVSGAVNYLTRQWYLDILVNDSLGNLEDAIVTIQGLDNNIIFQENTTAQGTVSVSKITEYVNTAGNTEFETPHTITVSKPLYSSNITIYNVTISQNIYHFVLLEIDSVPPIIIIHSPENTTYTTNVILLNMTILDDNLDTVLFNWNGTDVPYTQPINITYNNEFITLTVWANDSLGNFNSTNVSFTILLPDLIISEIFFEPRLYIEGQTRHVFVNVSNIASGDALDFAVFLNISYWNGTKTNVDEVFFNNLNLLAGQSQIVNTTWNLDIGKYIFKAEADYYNTIFELNKLNNFLEQNKTISAWQVLYGTFENVVLNLQNTGSNLFKEWNVSNPAGLLYFADIDAVFEPYNLRPINESGWLTLVDAALNLTGFDDSVSALFDTTNNGLPDNFTSAIIAGTSMDVPIIYSSNETTSFYTGLLYDSGSMNQAYDGTQAIVFVTFVDGAQVGAYGTYDYEIRVPVTLRDQFGAISELQRIIEIN